MSDTITYAMMQDAGNPRSQLILFALAKSADWETGVCVAKAKTLARAVHCSERTVWSHIEKLEEADFIERVERFLDDGRQAANAYKILGYVEWLESSRREAKKSRKDGGEKTAGGVCSLPAGGACSVVAEQDSTFPNQVTLSGASAREPLDGSRTHASTELHHQRNFLGEMTSADSRSDLDRILTAAIASTPSTVLHRHFRDQYQSCKAKLPKELSPTSRRMTGENAEDAA